MSTVSKAPKFTEDDAVRIAREKYGISAATRPLPSERDQNFLLENAQGQRYVLKIANASEKIEILEFQNAVMDHLNKNSPKEICPQLLPDISGRMISTAEDSQGGEHFVRLARYIEGVPLGLVNPQTPELLFELGSFIARLVTAFQSLRQKEFQENLIWNMKNGVAIVKAYIRHIQGQTRRTLIRNFLSLFEKIATPWIPSLPLSIIHNDANDYNIIVSFPDSSPENFGKRSVAGILDFGDMVYSYTLSELAVALAYVMLKKKDPLAEAASVVAGYHSILPLKDIELRTLFLLSILRLCMSVSISAYQKKLNPENDYLIISEKDIWELLEKLKTIHPNLAYGAFREACGMKPYPETERIVRWIWKNSHSFFPVVKAGLQSAKTIIFDLSPRSFLFQNLGALLEPKAFSAIIKEEIDKEGARAGIGKYAEVRLPQTHEEFKASSQKPNNSGIVHLGLDIFAEPGTSVFAPLKGTADSVQKREKGKMKGSSTLVLKHIADRGKIVFFTLYRHLAKDSLARISPGTIVRRGEKIGEIAESDENRGWPPHVHFQVILDLLSLKCDFPGIARYPERQVWLNLCPDPNLILNIQGLEKKREVYSPEKILNLRRKHIGKSLSLSYKEPLKIVRGAGQYLYDHTGKRYLDAVNNVPNVGHCHPEVVRAAARQMAVLNTNTRYLHDNLVRYAERLCSTMPEPLRVCFIVNSGSEANDLALRLARHYTGQKDVIVVDGAYHGNLSTLIEISPYKFNGPGGSGKPPHTQIVMMPDLYQGPFRYGDNEAGKKYAEYVRSAIEQVQREGRKIAAFIAESLMGCGGQIVFPKGYLKHAYRHIRNAGGLCIADEVQVGFARVGTHFWGFETQDVIPDIVTLGKPIGDGFPLAAVVTRPEIADAFANGMEYFNTYGGNPVSCAVGLAVLDVIEEEKLQENALNVGKYLKIELEKLKRKYALIGDVRGLGLFLGVELVKDRERRAPAPEHTAYIIERMKEEGVLISLDGPNRNVLKIKPPLVFTEDDADRLISVLDQVLAEDPVRIL
jgi:4-aminobutyrate aminotransferase-like enzyme/Ser/Thr protein kinase RdoA (MazF antagonist)